jgi:hypothetical protein
MSSVDQGYRRKILTARFRRQQWRKALMFPSLATLETDPANPLCADGQLNARGRQLVLPSPDPTGVSAAAEILSDGNVGGQSVKISTVRSYSVPTHTGGGLIVTRHI